MAIIAWLLALLKLLQSVLLSVTYQCQPCVMLQKFAVIWDLT